MRKHIIIFRRMSVPITLIVVMFLLASLFSSFMAVNNVNAESVKVKHCAAWQNNMSYTYMNQDLEKICTEEARKTVCPNRGWQACSDEGKGEEIVGQIEEEITSNVATSTNEDDGDDCFGNSGKIGWIICPIITGISGVGEWLWGEIETNFLQIPVGQFFRGGSGIETAWRLFRDMANVVFIILFLFVIFSQLTGIGIDNYGIKKIMPKLIVTAILINLSYVICVLAVDLSNILGTGLNALFTSLASQIPVNVKGVSGGQSLALAGISGGGLVLFGLISGPLGIVSAGLWVFGLIITIAMSMLFLFLILIIRSAGIVILIAIAPIAIVCYMLPNTEKLFKRWLDLLKALLFVYPICGALVGAGKLAGNLLASTNLEAMKVAGMVMEVLPFFLIPTILKQSLSLAGNIGARLSATGKNLGRRSSTAARGAITGSEKFKNWSNFQQSQRSAMRAGRVQRRLEGKVDNGGTLTRWQRAKLRTAQDTVLAHGKAESENELRAKGGYTDAMAYKQQMTTDAEAEAIARLNDPTVQQAERQSMADEARRKREAANVALMMQSYRSDTQDQLTKRWNNAYESGNKEDLSALTTVMHRRFGAAGMNSIANELSKKTGIKDNTAYQASMEALQQTLNENSSLAGDMKSKASDAFQMISNGGIAEDEKGNVGYQDMSWFSNHNKVATKSKDWATSSAATLKRGLAGSNEDKEPVIDDYMLNELLTSDDPAIAAFRSDAGNRHLLQAARQARDDGVNFANIADNKEEIQRLSKAYEAKGESNRAPAQTPTTTQPQTQTQTQPQLQQPIRTPAQPRQIILGGTNSDINAANRRSGYDDSNAARRNNNDRQMNL